MIVRTSEFKSITLITSPGKGLSLISELHKRNLSMINLHHARGSYIGAPIKKSGMPIETEQEIVTCVVDAIQADTIFAEIHELAEVNKPNGGFMYMQDLTKSTQYNLLMQEKI
ncbi:MAG: hypothetical protein A2Z20_06560 [Bdellovibrionales bacterium RBG_16_40_8]|nr:MAG: hypothetical protein A2Z20_06560 [Bdellovibrionales bacterium RBG_16_40_8]